MEGDWLWKPADFKPLEYGWADISQQVNITHCSAFDKILQRHHLSVIRPKQKIVLDL